VAVRVSGDIRSKAYDGSATIFRQGDAADCAYVVLEGRVRITASRNGHDMVLAILGPGDVFGEMALLDGKPRSATAAASAEGARVRFVSRTEFHEMLEDPFVRQMVTGMGSRLRAADELLTRMDAENAARHTFVEHRGLRRDWVI